MHHRTPTLAALLGLIALVACGGDDSTTAPPDTGPDTTAAAVAVVAGDGQTGTVGTTLPTLLGVRVTNAAGEPLATKSISWTVASGGGSLAGATSVTNASGEATNAYELGPTPGANSVRASVDGTSLSTTISATATAAPVTDTIPASIEIVSGNAQSAIVGEVLDSALIVVLRNAGGEIITGQQARSTWAVTAGDGTLLQTDVVANVTGEIINIYTVSTSPRTDTIEVSVSGDPSLMVAFTATASAAPATAAVSVEDNQFVPDDVIVGTGGDVTWNWTGSISHNVTWVSGGLANSATQSAGTHSVSFPNSGSFDYYCTIHGSPTSGMRGTVDVRD